MGDSQYPGVGSPLLFSPERFRGRDARAGVSLNLRNQVLFLTGRDREGLPHRGPQVILWGETEKALLSGRDARAQIPPTSGKKFSPLQGAVGHPLERQLQSLATHGMCLYAKNPSVKGSRPAIGPSMQSDSGLVPSSS